MTKRAISGLSRPGSGGFRAASLLAALLPLFCPGSTLRAADSLPSNSLSQATATALLEYQETDYSVINSGVSITPQSAPFKKEPAAAAGKVVRGLLNFGGNSSNSIPFLWQRDARKLFLDLNRNQDLTDDPTGVFSADAQVPVNYQTFTNVHLLFNTSSGPSPALADIALLDNGPQLNCFAAVRSFWQGKVTLHGRDCQVGIVQDIVNQPGSFENGQLLLRPWEERGQAFTAAGGSLDVFPFSPKLFVDGHAYQLSWIAAPQNGQARSALQFRDQSPTLGELNITGKFIQRLMLPGGPFLVILDHPAGIVKVPVGSYRQPALRFAQNGVEASSPSDPYQFGQAITVNDRTPAILAAGGPLTNTVTATRQGRYLRLDYKLIGTGAQAFQMTRRVNGQPPQFTVYKGGKKIASGRFEFG